MNLTSTHVCPVEIAGGLDNRLRRWLQNPYKILGPYIRPGMTVLDFGCGPGFFTIPMADMAGPDGRVFAVDLQQGMLDKVAAKARAAGLSQRIEPHQCSADAMGVRTPVDFMLAFYMVHEIVGQERFFAEAHEVIKPGGALLVVEPPLHVSRAAFSQSVAKAQAAGFSAQAGPKVSLSKSILLVKAA